MRSKLGHTVGYSVRFDDKSCDETRIKYVTDGILLRELMTDRNLERYNIVILGISLKIIGFLSS